MNFFQKLFTSSSKEVEYFQNLQKRVDEKYKFFEFIHGHMKDFTKILKTFYEKIDSHTKNLDNLSHTLEDQCLYDTYQLINQKIVDNIKNDYSLVEENLKLLDTHLKKYKTEIVMYDKLKEIYGNLVNTKEELKANKTSYHKSGPEMENKMKKFVENNDMNSLTQQLKYQLGNIVRNSKKALKKYEESITKFNNLSTDFNKKQEELFNYLPNFGKDDNEFFSIVTKGFLNSIKNNTGLIEAINKLMNNIQKSEKKDDLNNLITDSANNKKVERNVELVQYLSSLEFSKCKDQKEFDLFAKVIEAINKNMEEPIFPNYNYEIDLKNYKQSKLIKQVFEMKEVDEKAEKELLDSLDDKMNHKAIFIVLSQLRTNSTFQRPKSFITTFGKAFNKLISMAKKSDIIEYVKNCIILSQTYFYLDEDKKKRYLFEEIKSNKILNNSKFWRKFIDNVIKSEFDRFKTNHLCPDYDIEKCDKIPDIIKKKLDEIVFSQLLSFITSLSDFEMDKKVIVKITDEFFEKYKYLSQDNINSIYQIIAKDKEEIEKYRKEYDPSLESEDIEFKDENEKIKKENEIKEETKVEEKKEEKKPEEKKEDKKEEKKEENKIEEKKEDKKEENKIVEDKKQETVEEKKEEKKEEEKKEEKKDENNIEEENLDNNEIKNE